jgi:2-polyprenyl-3-methyl-5-hydroxy-6-metoxy-1,4-benzoquinol methylase
MKEDLISHYEEKYAEEKSSDSIELIPYRKYPVNRFESCVKYFKDNFQNGGTILELGAGNGLLANTILKQNGQINKYIISDLSENRLEGAKKSIQDKRVSIKRIDVEDFDFESIEKVDAVIMIALIEHLIDPLGAMKRIKRALKPDGFVYIDTPNIADYGARFKLLTGRFPSTASKKEGNLRYDNTPVTLYDEGHLHYFTYKSLSEMLIRYCDFKKTTKYFQMIGKRYFGKAIHHQLAKIWPEMFSSLILIAK